MLKNVAGRTWNPGSWNLECSSRNPAESHKRLESKIQGCLEFHYMGRMGTICTGSSGFIRGGGGGGLPKVSTVSLSDAVFLSFFFSRRKVRRSYNKELIFSNTSVSMLRLNSFAMFHRFISHSIVTFVHRSPSGDC